VTIPAHDNRIAAMSFNSLGNRIATASEKVTSVSLSYDVYITVVVIICLGSVLFLIYLFHRWFSSQFVYCLAVEFLFSRLQKHMRSCSTVFSSLHQIFLIRKVLLISP